MTSHDRLCPVTVSPDDRIFGLAKLKALNFTDNTYFLYHSKTIFWGGILESPCLSVENTTFCQSTGRGIESHLETALVFFAQMLQFLL